MPFLLLFSFHSIIILSYDLPFFFAVRSFLTFFLSFILKTISRLTIIKAIYFYLVLYPRHYRLSNFSISRHKFERMKKKKTNCLYTVEYTGIWILTVLTFTQKFDGPNQQFNVKIEFSKKKKNFKLIWIQFELNEIVTWCCELFDYYLTSPWAFAFLAISFAKYMFYIFFFEMQKIC